MWKKLIKNKRVYARLGEKKICGFLLLLQNWNSVRSFFFGGAAREHMKGAGVLFISGGVWRYDDAMVPAHTTYTWSRLSFWWTSTPSKSQTSLLTWLGFDTDHKGANIFAAIWMTCTRPFIYYFGEFHLCFRDGNDIFWVFSLWPGAVIVYRPLGIMKLLALSTSTHTHTRTHTHTHIHTHTHTQTHTHTTAWLRGPAGGILSYCLRGVSPQRMYNLNEQNQSIALWEAGKKRSPVYFDQHYDALKPTTSGIFCFRIFAHF